MSEPYTAIQVVMMPRDTNPHGTIFGGVILSHIDSAGAIAAHRAVARGGGDVRVKFVTVAMNRVEFKQPVHVGDVVRFVTTVERIGRTSITIKIAVIAERDQADIPVTEAEAVYVGIDPDSSERKPTPLFPNSLPK